MAFLLRRMNGSWEGLESPQNSQSSLQIIHFFLCSYFPISLFSRLKPSGPVPQSSHQPSPVSTAMGAPWSKFPVCHCCAARELLCLSSAPLFWPLPPRGPRTLSGRHPCAPRSPEQSSCVSEAGTSLPGWGWFQDSATGLSGVSSGWAGHFLKINNLNLFLTSQILSLSFSSVFGTKFHQGLVPSHS